MKFIKRLSCLILILTTFNGCVYITLDLDVNILTYENKKEIKEENNETIK